MLVPLEDSTESSMSKEQNGPFYIPMDDNKLVVQVVWNQQRLSA